MNFTTSFDNMSNMQTALLIDIFCWQQIIVRQLAEQEAEKHGCQFKDVIEAWETDVNKYREGVTNDLYEKYGPDLTEAIGLTENEG